VSVKTALTLIIEPINRTTTAKDISLHNLVCTAVTDNASAYPRNTDFFDSVNVNNLDVKNIWANIGDGRKI
jgi:galacturan 1,4-alpha-galacturonidase